MPSANVSNVETIHEGNLIQLIREGHPLKDIRRKFRENIHAANRIAKKELAKAVKRTLNKGVQGQGYNPEYAARKNRDPRSPRGGYSSSGPVDFHYSGRLRNELVGRGRAKPSENTLQAWVSVKNRNKPRPKSAPGSASTYGQLTRILKRLKPKNGTENPFSPDEQERDTIARRTAQEVLSLGN